MVLSTSSDAFKIHHQMMTATAVWPEENSSVFYKIRAKFSWLISISLCITMWMEALNDLGDFAKLSEILYIMVTVTAYLIKLAVFMYHRTTFLGMINFLKDPIFTSYPDDLDHYMARTIKSSTFLANSYRYLCGCCVLLYLVFPVLDNKPLPFPFPYDLKNYTYPLYAFQLFSVGYSAWNNSCLDTLCTSLMGIGAAQLDILAEKIVGLTQEEGGKTGDIEISDVDKKIIKKLKQCVEHHLAIIRFIEDIERVFTIGLLAQFVTSVIVICNTLFHFVLISISLQFFMLANYFVVMLTQLFIYCWYGNEIILKSTKIGEACYMFNWPRCGVKVRKHLFIMMERAKRPLKITAWKFSSLSLVSFAAMLQWSYSCLALLINMYNKRSSA